MRPKILLVGAGGHCKVILDLILRAKEYKVSGIIDLKERLGDKVLGVPVIGSDCDLPYFFKSGIKHCFITVGSIGNPYMRIKLYDRVKQLGFIVPNIISPNAWVSSYAILGEGNYVAPGVFINAGAQIGSNCIFNTASIIEHDCKIDDFVHISPGSILSGGVNIGKNAHIGAGSVIIQNIKIGKNTIIGAGSVVIKDLGEGVIAYGSPCKQRKKSL